MDGGTHVGKREGERETPRGILDHRALTDRENMREREINNLNPADPGGGRRARERDNERTRQRGREEERGQV